MVYPVNISLINEELFPSIILQVPISSDDGEFVFYNQGVISLSTDEAAKLWENWCGDTGGNHHTAGFSIIGENGHEVKDFPWTATLMSVIKTAAIFHLSYATNPWRRINAGLNLRPQLIRAISVILPP